MRTKLTQAFPETALERILEALEHELIEASDAEILEAADDLGMKPRMKGSAAFLGLRYSVALRAEDFFGAEWLRRVLNDPRRSVLASAAPSKRPEPPQVPPSRGSSRPPKEPRDS
jgi:hypothetical protein